jgi:hypothetical protein
MMRTLTNLEQQTAASFQAEYVKLFKPLPRLWSAEMLDWLGRFNHFQINLASTQ